MNRRLLEFQEREKALTEKSDQGDVHVHVDTVTINPPVECPPVQTYISIIVALSAE